MILGLGMDIVEVRRIGDILERHGERFLSRILLGAEVEYCLSQKNPAQSIAARFAAKEAVSKAMGTGIGAELGWQDIEVVRLKSGQPAIAMHGAGQVLYERLGGRGLHLSLTHTAEYAAAVAVLEG